MRVFLRSTHYSNAPLYVNKQSSRKSWHQRPARSSTNGSPRHRIGTQSRQKGLLVMKMAFKHEEEAVATPVHFREGVRLARRHYPPFFISWQFTC